MVGGKGDTAGMAVGRGAFLWNFVVKGSFRKFKERGGLYTRAMQCTAYNGCLGLYNRCVGLM